MYHAIFVLQRPDGALLVEYRTWCNDWVFPGGTVEEGETPLQAAAREAEEELGITAQSIRQLQIGETRTHRGNLIKAFLITDWDGDVPEVDNDNQAPLEWLNAEDMLGHQLESQRMVAAAIYALRNANLAYEVNA